MSTTTTPITDALDLFLVQLEADGRSRHTIGQYRRHVQALAAWATTEGLDDIAAIGHAVLARFLTSTAARCRPDGKTKKATTANALRTSLRCFFTYLHEAGLIAVNPARLIRRARCSPPPPRGLSVDEVNRLVAALEGAEGPVERRDRALFLLMLRTGIRIGSALALDIEDLDLPAGEARLRSMKGDREDIAYLPVEVAAALAEVTEGRVSGPVFLGAGDRRLSARHAQRLLGRWLAQAGVDRPASPHSLRHSFATGLLRRTGDVVLVQAALHHRSIASTMIYARTDASRVRAALTA
ncbi:MAG: tyrosine-type recombinase/integrase [Planctomycetes bacterium]|nr:tyrosine-type recombinase/integrase [Planctomycetota bacterium]